MSILTSPGKATGRLVAFVRANNASVVSTTLILAAVTLLRTFIENFSNPEPFGGFTAGVIILGFFLYFAGVLLMMTALLSAVTRERSGFIWNVLVYTSPVIVVAPILDLILSRGAGYCMSYIPKVGTSLLLNFFTFFGGIDSCGVTPGIRIEIVIILIGLGILVYHLTKNVFKTILGMIGTYVILFGNLALPGIIITIARAFGNTAQTFSSFFSSMLSHSLLPLVQSHIPGQNIYLANYINGSIFTARLSWVICLLFIVVVFYQQNKVVFKAYIRDFRFARIIYYSSLGLLGMWFAYRIGQYPFIPRSLPDVLAYIMFFAIIALSFTFAAATNDIVDIPIDAVTNTKRPLVTGALSVAQYKEIAFVLGLLIVSGSLLVSYSFFICMMLFHISFYLYSMPPLRLKRHFVTADALLAFAGLVTVIGGYSFFSVSPEFNSFPIRLAIYIFVFLFIIVNIRDFKDIEGDTKEGIRTLPVVLGEKKARTLIGVLVFILSIATGTYLIFYFFSTAMAFYAFGTAFLALMLFQKVDERIVFLLMYIVIIAGIILL